MSANEAVKNLILIYTVYFISKLNISLNRRGESITKEVFEIWTLTWLFRLPLLYKRNSHEYKSFFIPCHSSLEHIGGDWCEMRNKTDTQMMKIFFKVACKSLAQLVKYSLCRHVKTNFILLQFSHCWSYLWTLKRYK